MTEKKGLLLAGGAGSRLSPTTLAISKHLIPIFDKPLIYYSFSTLLLADCREIAVVCQSRDKVQLNSILGDGTDFGVSIQYIIQDHPLGIVDAVNLASEFLSNTPFVLALGDNLFFGSHFSGFLEQMASQSEGARIALKQVPDPGRFGVAWLSLDGKVERLEEKPETSSSDLAVTGIYFFDKSAALLAKNQQPSKRGELEITDLLGTYLAKGNLTAFTLPRGTVWQDTGTPEGILASSNFVNSFQSLTGQLIGSPHEIAWRKGWISDDALKISSLRFPNAYGQSLRKLLR
jgi:glucose-1-phosphate thymidylyltransferase